MKRILCPKCENYLSFDETKYSEGQSLVFVCEHCGKQFSIRLGKSKMKAPRKEEKLDEEYIKKSLAVSLSLKMSSVSSKSYLCKKVIISLAAVV